MNSGRPNKQDQESEGGIDVRQFTYENGGQLAIISEFAQELRYSHHKFDARLCQLLGDVGVCVQWVGGRDDCAEIYHREVYDGKFGKVGREQQNNILGLHPPGRQPCCGFLHHIVHLFHRQPRLARALVLICGYGS